MKFWLERGVDGFRIDAVNKSSKRTDFVDAPVTEPLSPPQPAREMWCNGPRIHEFIREMTAKALAPYIAVSVGQLPNTPSPSQVIPYDSALAREFDMVFDFSVIRLGNGNGFDGKYVFDPFPLSRLKTLTCKWQSFIEGIDAWTTAFCENHDNGRAVSRFGEDLTPKLWEKSAKTIALWKATMTGTLFLYQGQEIHMTNMPASWGMEEYKDIESSNFYAEAVDSDDPERVEKTTQGLVILATDHSRIPFQWTDRPNAGFADPGVKPWMRGYSGHTWINASRQQKHPASIISFYKRVLRLSKMYKDVFVFGAHRLLEPEDEELWCYVKESAAHVDGKPGLPRKALVAMNFSKKRRDISLGCGVGREEGEEVSCEDDGGHGRTRQSSERCPRRNARPRWVGSDDLRYILPALSPSCSLYPPKSREASALPKA